LHVGILFIAIFIAHEIISSDVIVIKDHQMVVRELPSPSGIILAEDSNFYTKSDSEDIKPIVDYEKCGKFDANEWMRIETKHPFYRTGQFQSTNRNEKRVFQLWQQMAITFDFINHG